MARRTCSKGHIYDSAIYGDNCPFCPSGTGTAVNNNFNTEGFDEYGAGGTEVNFGGFDGGANTSGPIPASCQPLERSATQLISYASEEEGVGILVQREKKTTVSRLGLPNLTKYTEYLVNQNKKTVNKFKQLTFEKTKVNEHDAYLFKFLGSMESGDFEITFIFTKYFIEFSDSYYVLQFNVYKDEEEQQAALLQKNTKSLKFLQ